MSFYRKGLREKVQKDLDDIKMHEQWAKDNPCWIDGVLENLRAAKLIRARLEQTGEIQVCCKQGFVLPDRCRYNSLLGCDCGAYPPTNTQVV